MFQKLDFLLDKYDELSLIASDPEVIANQEVWQKHMREMSEIEPIVAAYREYKKVSEELE